MGQDRISIKKSYYDDIKLAMERWGLTFSDFVDLLGRISDEITTSNETCLTNVRTGREWWLEYSKHFSIKGDNYGVVLTLDRIQHSHHFAMIEFNIFPVTVRPQEIEEPTE